MGNRRIRERHVRTLGPAAVAALGRVLRRRRLVTFEIPVPAAGSLDVAPPPGVVIRRGTADDAAALRLLDFGNGPLKRRFARGDIVVVAEADGQLVGCLWLAGAPPRLPWSGINLNLGPSERYGYGGYVLPDFRRRGINKALQRARLIEAQRAGATVVVVHSELSNRAALAAEVAVGAMPREASSGIMLLGRFSVTVWRRGLCRASRAPARRPAD